MSRTKVNFAYDCVELTVTAQWDRGYPGSREEPPEPSGWEIESITLNGSDVDLYFLLQDSVEEAAVEALETQAAYDADVDAAAREDANNRRQESLRLGESE
jgi:hypothetical protein